MITIQLWHSFACNNSSSYRLIARFDDAAAARTTGTELSDVFAKHAANLEVHETSPALHALATQYGFTWDDGGYGGRDDGPFAIVEGEVLIVYHDYCLGLGPGVPAFLSGRGARIDEDSRRTDLQISMLFRLGPNVDARLIDELDAIAAQVGLETPFQPPWQFQLDAYGSRSLFRDANTAGFSVPIEPRDIASAKAWLTERGIDSPVIRIDELADEHLFASLAKARCTACTGPLEYLDPRLHDIEAPQLVCKPCGGLYDLAAFV
jgi:hypothetical protein